MMNKDYVPLYPKLTGYWDKPFAELPEEWRAIVSREFWATTWDEANIAFRQDKIKGKDIQCDPTQEINTWHELFLYAKEPTDDGLDDGILHCIIEDARSTGNVAVACILKDHIAKPLAKFLDESYPYPHWPNTEPLLWRELYLFSRRIPGMRNKAGEDKEYALVLALDDVVENIERILEIDRDRVGASVANAIDAEFAHEDSITLKSGVRVSVAEQQDNVILKWLRENNYDPLKLPVPPSGKAGVKKKCRDDICASIKQLFLSVSVFNTAWERLRASGEIVDAR